MIILPDPNLKFEYENSYYLSCENSRIYKPIAQYELYKRIINIPGAIAEFGIFKGTSFIRFLTYRNMLEGGGERHAYGFDMFDRFPDATLPKDKQMLEKYLKEAGDQSISKEQLLEILRQKELARNVHLIEGDIIKTLPAFINDNPQVRFALLHLDVDLYEPSKLVLESCWERISPGGLLLLDDYGVWQGETRAVDEFIKTKNICLTKLPYINTPAYIIKQA